MEGKLSANRTRHALTKKDQALHDYGEALVSALDLPDPLTLALLLQRVSARRGRPVRLLPLRSSAADGVSALWVPLATLDVVYADTSTSPWFRDHCILHEVGHMLCGHVGPAGDQVVTKQLSSTLLQPDREREAEMVALLLESRIAGVCAASTEDVARAVYKLQGLLAALTVNRAHSAVGLPATDARSQLILLVTEVRDAQRALRRFIPMTAGQLVGGPADAAGLDGVDRAAVTRAVCMRLAIRRRSRAAAPARSVPLWRPETSRNLEEEVRELVRLADLYDHPVVRTCMRDASTAVEKYLDVA